MGKKRFRWMLVGWLVGCGGTNFTTVVMDGGGDTGNAGDATVHDSGQHDEESPSDAGQDRSPLDGTVPMDSPSASDSSSGDVQFAEGGNPMDTGLPPPNDAGGPGDTACQGLACSSTAECQMCAASLCCCGILRSDAGVCTFMNGCNIAGEGCL